MIKILDCTTRDAGHITNWEYDEGFVFEHIKYLNNSKVSYYEIGYRNYYETDGKGRFYKCDKDFLKKFYDAKENLQIGVMVDTKRFSKSDFIEASVDCIDFVRVACHPNEIQKALEIVFYLYEKGYKVFLQLMDVSNIDLSGYFELYKWEYKNILESIYIADSYGNLMPEDIEKYYNKLIMLGYSKISFHGHNRSQKALCNSLKAITMGAYSVDTTKDGIGRNGGNLSLDELLQNLNQIIDKNNY